MSIYEEISKVSCDDILEVLHDVASQRTRTSKEFTRLERAMLREIRRQFINRT